MSIQFTARPTPSRWPRVVAVLFVLSTITGGLMDHTGTAEAEPPDHAKGGKATTDDGQKCHPRKGCPDEETAPATADPTTEEPTKEPTTEPTTEPTPAPTEEPTQDTTSDPAANEELVVESGDVSQLMAHGRAAAHGPRTVQAYRLRSDGSFRLWVWDRDHGSAVSVPLPSTSRNGYAYVAPALASAEDLWMLGYGGVEPSLWLRHYSISGTAPNVTVTLTAEHPVGDDDSRIDDLIRLADGSLTGLYHQQGYDGRPQGHTLVRVWPDGSVAELKVPAWIPTRASRNTLVQHPSDGTVWLFASPDAYGQIGAARFAPTATGFDVLSVDNAFISQDDGQFTSDPELPHVIAERDPSNGTIVLAYQTGPARTRTEWGIATKPAIARITAGGDKSFTLLDRYVERTNRMAVAARDGQVWLGYREYDLTDGSHDELVVSSLSGGSWSHDSLGTVDSPGDPLVATQGSARIATIMGDAQIHVYAR